MQSEVTAMEASLHKLDEQKERYSVELNDAVRQYRELSPQDEQQTGAAIRSQSDQAASACLKKLYGKQYNSALWEESCKEAAALLGEDTPKQSLREQLHRLNQDRQHDTHRRNVQEASR